MNGQEIEAKFYVRNLTKIELRLLELKAQLIQPRTHEINLRFDNAENELVKSFRVLRLRQDEKARITYKGPNLNQSGDILIRPEIEFVVDDFVKARDFLEALGYGVIFFYEKFRATYEFDGIQIMLDELPYGEFVEIEGENVEGIYHIANLLGLDRKCSIHLGYHALFIKVAEIFNLNPAQLRFAAFENVRITAGDLGVVAADGIKD
jgi:adenylate cyclase class 2